jgi:feruloyl esterase
MTRARVATSGLTMAAALIAFATSSRAETAKCSEAALTALNVPRVSIASATIKPNSTLGPEHCDVIGSVTTTGEGAPDGSAKFELRLPVAWNGKFLFWGVGGLAGNLTPSASLADIYAAVGKGYATARTDTGHEGNGLEAGWALVKPGQADDAKLADYYFRAIHQVTLAARQVVEGYFGRSVARSYFDGCSNGGREALIEAERYPDDYDGIIAGAPFMDLHAILSGVKAFQRLLDPAAYLPAALLPAIDRATTAACDGLDGVKDGLIQNPARCSADLQPLLCKAAGQQDCLTEAQLQTLIGTDLAPLRDAEGRVLYPGGALGGLANGGLDSWVVGEASPSDFNAMEPWAGDAAAKAPLSWHFTDQILKYIIERDPAFDIRAFKIGKDGVVDPGALALFDQRTAAADADDPKALARYLSEQKKLLMYHGYSDPALAAYRTIMFYQALAAQSPGRYPALQNNVRLFMAPEMHHCGGGTGPNSFDAVTALETWVEQGRAPDAIIAAHHPANDLRQPADRTMPLCPFPAEAKYRGKGDVNDAANWSCTANQDLLNLGSAGVAAGLTPQKD